MATPGDQRTLIASGLYRALAIGVLVLLALMTLGGVVDPVSSADGPAWPGLFIMVLLAALIVRAARLGLVIEREELTTRGLLVSRRMATSNVLRIEAVGYSGQLNWYGESRFVRMLRLDLRNGSRDVPMVVAFGKRAHPLQQRANAALRAARAEQG